MMYKIIFRSVLVGLVFTLLITSTDTLYARVLKIATLSPDGTAWMKKMRQGAAEIKTATEGRVSVKFYPGGIMGNDKSVLRKIRVGQLHGGAIVSGSLTRIYPDINIYGLPLLFSSHEEVDAVRKAVDQQLISGLEEKGFVSFGLAEGGFTYLMSEKALHTLKDVRKEKMWVPAENAMAMAVFRSAKISPIPLQLADVLTGLQTGLINSIIASPIAAVALQWHTRLKYLVDFPLSYLTAQLVIDNRAFSKLSKIDQKVVRSVMTKAFSKIDSINREDNKNALQALVGSGIELLSLSDESIGNWKAVAVNANADLNRNHIYSEELLNKIKQILVDVRSR